MQILCLLHNYVTSDVQLMYQLITYVDKIYDEHATTVITGIPLVDITQQPMHGVGCVSTLVSR